MGSRHERRIVSIAAAVAALYGLFLASGTEVEYAVLNGAPVRWVLSHPSVGGFVTYGVLFAGLGFVFGLLLVMLLRLLELLARAARMLVPPGHGS